MITGGVASVRAVNNPRAFVIRRITFASVRARFARKRDVRTNIVAAGRRFQTREGEFMRPFVSDDVVAYRITVYAAFSRKCVTVRKRTKVDKAMIK